MCLCFSHEHRKENMTREEDIFNKWKERMKKKGMQEGREEKGSEEKESEKKE